jgi:hypothetical protein
LDTGQIEKIKEQISKTGFVLENEVCKILEENKWNIINNRYYLDDIQNINREIDIIAYKVYSINDILYYTTLIISCKKSEKDYWSFLTKDIRQNDPNINLCPINNWSNDKILNFMLSTQGIEDRIISLSDEPDKEYLDFIYGINQQVFAFQQMKRESFAPNNDKDIYNSIITTIKALEYEKISLDKRITNKALYNFNILSIFDGEMIQIHFDNEKKDQHVKEIDEIKYLNRHIVNKKESFYRVHFMKYNKLDSYMEHLNQLAQFHTEFYPALIEEYYNKLTDYSDDGSFNVLINDFESELLWHINYLNESDERELDSIKLEYKKDENKLYIVARGKEIDFMDEIDILAELNENESIIKQTKRALKMIYKYEGDFLYEHPLPF